MVRIQLILCVKGEDPEEGHTDLCFTVSWRQSDGGVSAHSTRHARRDDLFRKTFAVDLETLLCHQ